VVSHLRFAIFEIALATVDLSQRAFAPLTVPSAVISDRPVASLHTPAAARAVTPFAPVAEFTVAVFVTALLIARLENFVHTFCDMAALIRLLHDHSRLPPETTPARSSAWPPATPLTPLPIDTMLLVTGILVALSDLRHRLG